jgi:hypothetical protein
MDNNFDYYLINPIITKRTVLLMGRDGIDTEFLFYEKTVDDNHLAHLQFLMPHRNPDMNVDFFDLETRAVFSKKVYTALKQYIPIKNLQLVEAIIHDKGKEYKNLWIAHVYRLILSFDVKLSTYDEIDEDGLWFGLEKIVLDKDLLSKIPLEDRLIFLAKEDCAFTLYHKSIVDIIMSVNPIGFQFIKVEDWRFPTF